MLVSVKCKVWKDEYRKMKIVKEDRMERTKLGNAITRTSAMARLPVKMEWAVIQVHTSAQI